MSAVAPFPAASEEFPDAAVLSAALQACSEGFAIVHQGCVQYANPAFARTFGLPHAKEMRGRELAEFLPDGATDVAAINPIHVLPASGGGGSVDHTQQARTCTASRGGGTTRLQLTKACFGVHGEEWEVVTVPTAIAESSQAGRQMQAVGRLVAGVAHDFNNLLTGILLYCDLLRAGLRKTPQLNRYVEEMGMAAERGSGLIRRLLDLSRQQPRPRELSSWNDVVREWSDFLRRLIGENIVLATDLAADLALVEADPVQLQQVLVNLVLNARDAMPDGGQITLATRSVLAPTGGGEIAQPGLVEFSVTDSGTGMDEETRAHLCTPFFTTKLAGQGSGLGLATVHSIVQQENGTLQVESAPGRGTRVIVRLPQAPSPNSDRSMP